MIHHVPNQLKFKRFVRLLRPLCTDSMLTPEGIAVCVLERLWHATMANAQAGDIGKLSDVDIAEAIGWLGEPTPLVNALVAGGWLDRCEVHRLVVHDWHEHCPTYLKGAFTTNGKQFAIATCKERPAKQTAIATLQNKSNKNLTELTELDKPTCAQPASAVSQEFWEDRWEEIRCTAQAIKDRIDPGGRLVDRNRQLGLTLVSMSLLDEPAGKIITNTLSDLYEGLAANKIKKPWGWLKSQVIKRMNASREGWFDELWRHAKVPPERIERKQS